MERLEDAEFTPRHLERLLSLDASFDPGLKLLCTALEESIDGYEQVVVLSAPVLRCGVRRLTVRILGQKWHLAVVEREVPSPVHALSSARCHEAMEWNDRWWTLVQVQPCA